MRTFSLAYIGPGMSGRRTSLASVLRASGIAADALTLDAAGTYEFDLGRKISARISGLRSSILMPDSGDRRLERRLRLEREWIRDADGIVVVLDSQPERQPANREQVDLLIRDLRAMCKDLNEKPVVFQLNKRDLSDAVPSEVLKEEFRTALCEHVDTIATQGIGVVEAVRAVLRLAT